MPKKSRQNWMKLRTYATLKKFSDKHALTLTPSDRWAIMERMRELRYGYKPGTIKIDKTITHLYSMEEFRTVTEQEYREEIKRYGSR